MRIDGDWQICEDGTVRPIFRGVVQGKDGNAVDVLFLADTGADHTTLCADDLESLSLAGVPHHFGLEGLGGRVASVVVNTEIRLRDTSDVVVTFKGQFYALSDVGALDMSVLGRDISNHFALIVDRPQDVVCLIGQGHKYQITSGSKK
jgi:hypothetical protein